MKITIPILVISFILLSCGSYTTSTVIKAEKAFLKFTGNKDAAVVSVDDGPRFGFNRNVDLYEVKPGKRKIKVYRNDQLIVDRTMIIDNETTYEIEIP